MRRLLGVGAILVATVGALVTLSLTVGGEIRDLLLTFGGAAVAFLASRALAAFQGVRRASRARAEMERFSGASIDWGRLHLPLSFLVAACGREEPLTQFVRFEFDTELAESRPDPPEWPILEKSVLRRFIETAANDGTLFEDDSAVDLVRCRTLPPQPGEPVVFRLTGAPTSYHRFAATSNALDAELADYGANLRAPTLRALWATTPRELSEVGSLPAPAKIGTVTVVVSADELVVCQERAILYQSGARPSGRRRTHFVGEGMSLKDVGLDGRLSPEVTARRGLAEELGLTRESVELIPTGVFFDGERWQPVFCFLARVDETAAQIQARLPNAPHRFETRTIHPRPWSVADADTRALLIDADRELELASNHAQVALFLALAYRDGPSRVIASLNG